MGDKMELKELIETRMYRVLKKKGYETVEDMARLFPRKYHDFSSLGCLDTNLDGEMRLAQAFGIQSIPTVIIFKDGKPVKQSIGFASKEKLEKMWK